MISLLVMAITFSVSLTGYFARFNTLTTEFKEISSFLAEACVEKALLSLAANSNYAGNENITVNGRQCAIFPIEISGSDKIIKTKATVENAVTNLKVQAASVNLSITSWEELPNL
ncbi:MAG: hypothetical protein HYR95_01530 [Candidatus Colwellbacteria bacterium]|nr:hypothetical protein [Candidatus Colwellbacteria bacterium]MBI3274171.1 hypothetical protein [Candidatus Colwellbacteria bacterium]